MHMLRISLTLYILHNNATITILTWSVGKIMYNTQVYRKIGQGMSIG